MVSLHRGSRDSLVKIVLRVCWSLVVSSEFSVRPVKPFIASSSLAVLANCLDPYLFSPRAGLKEISEIASQHDPH